MQEHHEEGGACRTDEYCGPRLGPECGPAFGSGFGLRAHMRRHRGRPRLWELIPTREEQIALLESAKANMERDLEEIERRLADLKGETQADS